MLHLALVIFIVLLPLVLLSSVRRITQLVSSSFFFAGSMLLVGGMALFTLLLWLGSTRLKRPGFEAPIWPQGGHRHPLVRGAKSPRPLQFPQELAEVLALTASEFEGFTGRLLAFCGYEQIQRVGGSGDLGIDLVALDGRGSKVVVQCKKFKPGSQVTSPTIQQFIGMMHVHHRAQQGIVVTTSTFTQPAMALAKQHGIILIDGVRLLTILRAMHASQQSQVDLPQGFFP